MPDPKPAIKIRDLQGFHDLKQAERVEREIWGISDLDAMPTVLAIATKEAGSLWIGGFDGSQLVGFAFGFPGLEDGHLTIHSHMLGVLKAYRDSDLGYKLKLAQRDRVLALRVNDARVEQITWTFDPLQSKNAHLNFAKLGVVSNSYKVDFYGPSTSSVLHQNSTDRLWVKWPIASRRVEDRLRGKSNRTEMLELLSNILPLVQFNGDGRPTRTDLSSALGRQRIAIEIPSDIGTIEQKDIALAQEWRAATRWAFTEALKSGFFVAEFCRTVRGQQGPGAYLLEKGSVAEYVPELGLRANGSR